jgi:hypothetical protein
MKQRVAEKQRERVINQASTNDVITNAVDSSRYPVNAPRYFSARVVTTMLVVTQRNSPVSYSFGNKNAPQS